MSELKNFDIFFIFSIIFEIEVSSSNQFFMKKISILFIFIFASFFASAQTRFGVKGGIQLADMRNKPDDRTGLTDETKMLFGYQAGVVLDYSFNKVLFFQPGLQVNSKGSKIQESLTLGGITTKTTIKANPLYVEMPLLLGVRFGLENLKIYGMAGPYLAYGVAGKNTFKLESISGGTTTVLLDSSEPIKWGNETSLSNPVNLRRFDMGLTVSAGVELRNMQLGVYYSPGFVNISPDNSGRELFNSNIGLSATLLFGDND
jgi:Outer membrane protein beta-barrel domain